MPKTRKTPFTLSQSYYTRLLNQMGEVKCRDPRCLHPEIKVGDRVITRTNHNKSATITYVYHVACALQLNIITEEDLNG